MRIVTADDIDRVLRYDALIDALAEAFRADIAVPDKIAHFIPQPSGREAKVLLMPAWTNSGERFIGHKLVNVFPDNAKRNKPAVLGSYLLMSGDTGETLAVMDGAALTAWRTACASALAARYLAREDASHLVMVGAGALAPHLIRAHRAVRPITRVTLVEPDALARDLDRVRAVRRRHRAGHRRRSGGGGARGRHRVLRDAVADAARSRRLAEEGRPCRSGRRVLAQDARGRRRGGAPRPRLCRQPGDRAEGLGRHRHSAEEEGHQP